MGRLRFVVVLVAACACGERPSAVTHGSIGGGAVARVGQTVITADLVAHVASAQRVEPREALDKLVADALAAEAARARKLDASPGASQAIRATLGRATVAKVRDAARAAGPPTDAETNEMSRFRWREVDCPEQVRVIHVIAMRPDKPKAPTGDAGEPEARARQVAASLLDAVRGAQSDGEFESKAKAVPHEGVDVRVERLPLFARDGRVVEGPDGATMVMPFVDAAFRLEVQATSDVIETEFGWHVLRVLEKKPAILVSADARRALFADDILNARARHDLERRLAAQRKAAPVEIASGIDALLSEAVAPPPAP
jgi:peptidyl-prolyl cis-trans isomerase C